MKEKAILLVPEWTREGIEENIRINVSEYGAMIVVAALFKKLYGIYPSIGLSGMQAEFADSLYEHLPDKIEVKDV